MSINDFKPFAVGPGANVTPQADWEKLPALLSGFMSGKASSAQINKAIRQAAFIAASLAQYTAEKSGEDVLDDGDVAGFIAKMSTAFGKDFQPLDATLTALASLATGANKLPYFTAADTAALTTLTSTGRDIIGKNTVADVLSYLGLGDGSMLPVGTPIPWPLATPPTGFLKMNGATFDKVANPKLALAYPSGTLPDLRAQTIRGWDDGRGVDTGRALLSEQGDAIRNITGSAANVYTGNPDLATGAISYSGTGITSWQSGAGLSISYRNLNFSAATQVPTAAENRVKSVAFNYIVRAQ